MLIYYTWIFTYLGYLLTSFCKKKKVENFQINFWQKEGHSKMAPLLKIFKCLNAPRFKFYLGAFSIFSSFFEIQNPASYKTERVSLNILKGRVCGLLPFVRKGQSYKEPLWKYSLLLTTQSSGVPGTHLMDLGRMKGWVDFGATQWFWTQVLWIRNPVNH